MRNRRHLVIGAGLLAMLLATVVSLGSASAGSVSNGPFTGQAESYALSPPVRSLPPSNGSAAAPAPARINPLTGEPGSQGATQAPGDVIADPLAASSQSASGRTPPLDLRFRGTSNPFACDGCAPPDTIGDVGPNHYIQMVNATKVAIFDKTGTLLKRFDLGDLWPSGPCSDNFGDPVVLYDQLAHRWLLAQFAVPHQLCFAISRTPNPLGSFHIFRFNVGQFPDYFKVGVWPTGYYVSANESTYTAYAFDRNKMLAGDPSASFVKFTGETNFLLPADVDGSKAPTDGGLFYTFKDDDFHGGVDRIELFRLKPDFDAPANSTFDRIKRFPITPFTYTVCGFFNFDCIPQRDTNQRVDAVSEWPMWRFAYRRFANRQELVGNFTVGGGKGDAGAAIRWFELRDTGSGYFLRQEGTQDPGNAHDRFMGSIAMDRDGNIALGYSISSSTLFPSIRYAVHSPGDPLGTMQPERTLRAGGGSQLGPNRWGDYSAMSVDPATGCQFWYTNEYYNPTARTDWKTQIGAFTVPGCGPGP